jgi:hypothetical protein
MIESRAETDDDQDKGNNYDAFYNHDVILLTNKVLVFSVIQVSVPIG